MRLAVAAFWLSTGNLQHMLHSPNKLWGFLEEAWSSWRHRHLTTGCRAAGASGSFSKNCASVEVQIFMQAVIPDAQHVGQKLASVSTSGCFLPFSFNSIIFRYLRAPLGWAIQLRGSLIQQDQGHFPVSSTARPSSNLDPTLFAACAQKNTRLDGQLNQTKESATRYCTLPETLPWTSSKTYS